MRRVRRGDERGAVAIMMAGLMTVVVIVAAMGVDLGNAWQRKITVQKSVDVSAISAGDMLPRTDTNEDDIYKEVAKYLLAAPNQVNGQGLPASSNGAINTLAADLHDGDPLDGEVTFVDDETMTVVAPQAHVDYGLAGIFGFDSTEVSAGATVQIRTPIVAVEDVLPMWLPATCVYGPLAGDTDGAPAPTDSPDFTHAGNPRGTHETGLLSPATTTYATTGLSVDVPITDIPAGKTATIVRFSFGDTKYIDYRVPWTTPTTDSDNSRTVTIALDDPLASRTPADATITSTTGDWQVWPLIHDSSAEPPSLPIALDVESRWYPKNNQEGVFTVTGGGAVACDDNEVGNFGQLQSPRKDETRKEYVYARNMAYGLDHELATLELADPTDFICTLDGDPDGALLDNQSVDGRNCLDTDGGNDGPALTAGLLGGNPFITDGDGRLQEPTNPNCGSDIQYGSNWYNNDTLSCFLKDGFTLADIAKDSDVPEDALDISIYDSPRFFWVPVVWALDREGKQYVAIKTFAPAFLTDESTSGPAGENNGLVFNSSAGGQVKSVQVFGFHPDALPVKPNAPTTEYEDGGRKVVRLIG